MLNSSYYCILLFLILGRMSKKPFSPLNFKIKMEERYKKSESTTYNFTHNNTYRIKIKNSLPDNYFSIPLSSFFGSVDQSVLFYHVSNYQPSPNQTSIGSLKTMDQIDSKSVTSMKEGCFASGNSWEYLFLQNVILIFNVGFLHYAG